MGWILVKFVRSRRVKVDDEYSGRTDELIEVEDGAHVVTLGPPPNWSPPEGSEIQVDGEGTEDPLVVELEEIET